MAPEVPSEETPWHRPWLLVPVVAAIAGAVLAGVTGLPGAGRALTAIGRQAMTSALPRWGTTEVVSEVVYGSRGWDTFGETFLLLAAVVATVLLSRGREPRTAYVGEESAGRAEQRQTDPGGGTDSEQADARAAEREESDDSPEPAPDSADDEPLGTPAPERAAAMTVVVRVGARVAAPVLAVAAVYLAALGYTPGGGFPAGAALVGVAVLLYAALGHRAVRGFVRPSVLEPVELAGAAAIVAVGLGGLAVKGSFLDNWVILAPQQTIRAGGTLQLFSGAELVEVATGLGIAIFALLGMGHDWTPDENDDESDDDSDDSDDSEGSDDSEDEAAAGSRS
jgi:multicomponent Na+:H+ antiporter subunit B